MELDDLRRQWQTQPVGPAPTPEITEQTLRTMLAQRTAGPIAQLKENAQRDLRIGIPILLLNLFNALNLFKRHGLTLESRLLVMVAVGAVLVLLAWSLWRRRQLVRQLDEGSAALYGQLSATSRQLRQFLRTSRWLGIGVLLVVIGLALYKTHAQLLAYLSPAAPHWGEHLTVFVLGGLGAAGLVAALFAAAQAKQTRRYGKYLDQLDAAVRELEETRAAR